MKCLNFILATLVTVLGSMASAQAIYYQGNLQLNDFGWADGKTAFGIWANYPQQELLNQLGCFPTGSQVPLDSIRVNPDNQNYSYHTQYAGTLAPGESIKIQFTTCNGGGDQPIIQSSVNYEFINRKIKLAGYWIDPRGVRQEMYHPTTTLPSKTMWGGVSFPHGMPGTWTFVVYNPTRYPIKVFGAGFSVVLF